MIARLLRSHVRHLAGFSSSVGSPWPVSYADARRLSDAMGPFSRFFTATFSSSMSPELHQTKTTHTIAVIPGDGIGCEVMPEGIEVLQAAGQRFGIEFAFEEFDWGCERYRQTGQMMPSDGIEHLQSNFDAVFLGAVGYPDVPDHISLWGLLLPIRRDLMQYVNLRPVRLLEGIPCPLANREPGDIDYFVVRENVEGEYSQIGGRLYEGTDEEMVTQNSCFTRKGTDRILKFAFELAQKRQGKAKVTSATKSNGLFHTMPYWDERFHAMAANYPDIETDQFHIDILTAHFVLHPDWFDVVVGSNLFGDILSDLGPATTGSIGIAPSANLNPERTYPSMFEPVHGSAPDIAGLGVANPIGQIWAGAMMLEHLGHSDAARAIEEAFEGVIASGETGLLTPDLGGRATTQELGEAIAEAVSCD